MNKLVCITGLCGAGKSIVSDYFVNKHEFKLVRFGQLVLDEVIRRGQPPSEALERQIREEFRAKYGMAAMATLNLPKFEELLKFNNVVGDGMYSFEEYKVLKEHFGKDLIVIAVFAPPELRYNRISSRHPGVDDTDLRHRTLSVVDAKYRDIAELEHLNKGATIAMADITLINTQDQAFLYSQLDQLLIDLK